MKIIKGSNEEFSEKYEYIVKNIKKLDDVITVDEILAFTEEMIKRNLKALNFVKWHIKAYTDAIEDYLDDPVENGNFISEYREDREHYKDIEKILVGSKEKLYMDFLWLTKEIEEGDINDLSIQR